MPRSSRRFWERCLSSAPELIHASNCHSFLEIPAIPPYDLHDAERGRPCDNASMSLIPDIASLLPEGYASWRPLVRDAFLFFIESLSRTRRAALISGQAALPPNADAATRLVHLMHECPTLHKIGQVLARHRGLDPGLRSRLQLLESFEPRTPWSVIGPIISSDLAPFVGTYSIEIEPRPLAEASVAVVVPFRYRVRSNGGEVRRVARSGGGADAAEVQRGVLKVLKPEIPEKLREELAIVGRLADYLDERRTDYELPLIEYRDTLETVRQLLQNEVLFEHERENLKAAFSRYADDDLIVIPRVLQFGSPRIIAMSRIDGAKITDRRLDDPGHLARTLIEALILRPILDPRPDASFHADPHAGNLFATPENRLAILDWSLTGVLSIADREIMTRAMLAAAMLDETALAERIFELCEAPPAGDRLREVIRRSMRTAPMIPGPSWFIRLLDDAAVAGARFSGDLLLFRKTFLTVQGVAADLCDRISMDEVLMAGLLGALAAEWPMRGWMPFESRSPLTHLSNLDLAAVMWSAPLIAMRRWSAWWGLPLG